ncbi:MAG: DUF1570 domain-containing protein [Pirellulaceae bacterium]
MPIDRFPLLASLFTVAFGLLVPPHALGQLVDRQAATIKLRYQQDELIGTAVLFSAEEVRLLGRDGQIWHLDPNHVADYAPVEPRFRPASQAEVRGQLLREYGRQFEVSGTGHYLVVHPAGQRQQWAERFEQLYRSFHQYFTARGIPTTQAEFPLVAVVMPNYASYREAAAEVGVRVSPGLVGFYSPRSNRVMMYDMTSINPALEFSEESMATLIHEATHQTAFNAGVHSRLAPQPKWLVEGLATMFEAPGVWNSREFPRQADRIVKTRLAEFQQYMQQGRQPNSLADFVAEDTAYLRRPATAYGEGWALCFYLIETRPREFAKYLQKVATRAADQPYPAEQRLADFQTAFGEDPNLLESHFLRYIGQLRRQ